MRTTDFHQKKQKTMEPVMTFKTKNVEPETNTINDFKT